MGVSHVLKQDVAVLESLGAQLARKRRALPAVETQMAAQRLLLTVRFVALGTAVPDAVVKYF